MKTTRGQICLWLLPVLISLLLVPKALAQSGDYDLDWWTVDGGGASPSAGTGYSLGGTIGQPDAARWVGSETSPYALSGGFWFTGPAIAGYEVFLPVVVRGGP